MTGNIELALDAYRKVEQAILRLDGAKEELALRVALLNTEDRAEYYAQTVKIDEEFEAKREKAGLL